MTGRERFGGVGRGGDFLVRVFDDLFICRPNTSVCNLLRRVADDSYSFLGRSGMSDFGTITDPAREIADLGETLFAIPPSDQPTFNVLAGAIGLPVETSEFLLTLAGASRRIEGLSEYVRTTTHGDVGTRSRTQALEALGRLGQPFRPAFFARPWREVHSNFIQGIDIAAMEMFSAHMRHVQPLRRLSDEERTRLLSAIDDAIADTVAQSDLREWMKAPLLDGLRQLRLIVQHIAFFGHGRAIDDLFNLSSTVEAVQAAAQADAMASGATDAGRLFVKVLQVLVFAGALFTVADQSMTALDRYKGWMVPLIARPDTVASETLLLPPPDGGGTPGAQ
ncbi:hypothetical protein [Xanthobacter wiegelii]|uniref:hypothetical protein n=1 Tax=Xanthobacter wiegelii TaxID=3119913 RepID=UPI00372B464C